MKHKQIKSAIVQIVQNIDDIEDIYFLIKTLKESISQRAIDISRHRKLSQAERLIFEVTHLNLSSILNSILLRKQGSEIKPEPESKLDLKLPSELKKYNEIATPVIELFKLFFTVVRDRNRENSNIACWRLTESKTKEKAYLYLAESFEWSIENGEIDNDELPESFDFDIYSFCSDNDIYLDESYESLDMD